MAPRPPLPRRSPAVVALLVALMACLHGTLDRARAATNAFRIAGYLPDYRAPGFKPDSAAALTDLILFSAEPGRNGALDLSRLRSIPWAALQSLRSRHGTRLHLAIGGWGLSAHFKGVAASPETRAAFAASVAQAAEDLGLDGIDLDWEHPANAAEEDGYGLLLADLRQILAPKGRVLSVTIAGWQRLTPLAIQSAHFVQRMAYDQPGPHATFEGAAADLAKLARLGVPRSKIVLGLPFYGRHRTQRQETLTYHEILQRFAPGPATDDVSGFAFNGPETIRRKVALARDEGLAGVMAWEVGQDAPAPQSLLQVVADEASARPALLMAAGRRSMAEGFQILGAQLTAALAQGGPAHAIDVCSAQALPLTTAVGQSQRLLLRRVSHAPRQPSNAASTAEQAWIARFQSELRQASNAPPALLPPAPILRTNDVGQPVFYAPIVLANPICLSCHGQPGTDIAPATLQAIRSRYPSDKATGFRLGDVRGLWKAEWATGP